jgi:hypothetical protein
MVCYLGFAAVQKMISSLRFNNNQDCTKTGKFTLEEMDILKTEDLILGVRTRITAGLHTDKIGIVLAKGTQTILLDIGEPSLICELPEHLEPVSNIQI